MPALARDQYTRNKIFISSSSIYKLHIYKIDITALTYEFVNDLKATLKSPMLDLNPECSIVDPSKISLFLNNSLFHPKC